jgi:SHS2 domain-containing protein
MRNYRVLDHTADIGIAVSGKSKKELFAHASAAMLDLIIGREPKTVRLHPEYSLSETEGIAGATLQVRTITVEGNDPEDLLINFLREVLYLFYGEKWVTTVCRPLELTSRRIVAQLLGQPYDLRKQHVKTEIKAVTYHGLNILKTTKGWKAKVIFDV